MTPLHHLLTHRLTMKHLHLSFIALASWAGALAPAQAGIVQGSGSGTVVHQVQHAADFEANTGLANPWAEGGLVFSHTGLDNDNGGCGYAGEFCVDLAAGEVYSLAFSGNHYATAGPNAYLRISSPTADLRAIELAVDSGFNSIHLLWQTWLDGVQTGTGRVSFGAQGVGAVLALKEDSGTFDELRLYAFDSASDTSGYSAPAVDSVRAFAAPTPGSLALLAPALLALGLGRRPAQPRRG